MASDATKAYRRRAWRKRLYRQTSKALTSLSQDLRQAMVEAMGRKPWVN